MDKEPPVRFASHLRRGVIPVDRELIVQPEFIIEAVS